MSELWRDDEAARALVLGAVRLCQECGCDLDRGTVGELVKTRILLRRIVAQYDLQVAVIMSAVEDAAEYLREIDDE